jgi:hypothetical protein
MPFRSILMSSNIQPKIELFTRPIQNRRSRRILLCCMSPGWITICFRNPICEAALAPAPSRAVTGSGPNGTFIGYDFRGAYAPGVTLDGSGQTVALVEFDTFASRDITSYEHLAGLPTVPVTSVPVDGFKGPPGGGQPEVSLDIEMAISMAPGLSQVLCYEAPYGSTSVNDDLFNQIAVDDLANQISCSWYYTIDPTTDIIFLEMAAQGQSFFNASGDYGAYYFDVFQPMGDPNITIVGGTTLTTAGAGGPWRSETVWNWFSTGFGTDASSGGTSSIYGIPYWQQAVNMSSNQGSSTLRNVPDVSMTGDNVYVATGDSSETVGGTSCAAPLWAGFTALINQQAAQNGRPPVGFLNPAIYGLAQSSLYSSLFHDTTNGNNTNYNGSTKFYAVPGFDLCTGWGTPTGQPLIDALAPPDSLTLQPRGGLSFAVANGYPLPIQNQTLALKSSESTTNDWAFGPVPAWLNVSVTHGAVLPGEAAFVTLSADGSATNLPPGNYVTNLLLTNTTASVTHLIPIYLTVFDPLLITPDSELTVTGPSGGPFDVTSQTYTLTNFASVPMDWTIQSTSPFLDIFPNSGTLQPDDSTNVIPALDVSASNILIGVQTGNLIFTDSLTTNQQVLPFVLNVGNGGFETGDFSDWNLGGAPDATNVAYNFVSAVDPRFAPYIHSGEFAAILGEPNQTASLSQTFSTVSNQLYEISLFLDNPVGGATNQFEVLWDGTTLFNQTEVPQITWTNMQFTVIATNTASTFQLIFRNDPDAFGLDDISIIPVPAPVFSASTLSNNVIVFSWNAIPGVKYQLKSSLDLNSWLNVNHPIIATNTVMTSTATVRRADTQQFFKFVIAQVQ